MKVDTNRLFLNLHVRQYVYVNLLEPKLYNEMIGCCYLCEKRKGRTEHVTIMRSLIDLP